MSVEAEEGKAVEVPESKTPPEPVKPDSKPDKPVAKPAPDKSQDVKSTASSKPQQQQPSGRNPSPQPSGRNPSPQPSGRTTYDRTFLLSFKKMDVCKTAPVELMNHDCFRTQ